MSSLLTGALNSPQFKDIFQTLQCSTFVSAEEQLFIEQVYSDLCTWSNQLHVSDDIRVVLLFPAFPPRLRFLVHQLVECGFPPLKTFSIGSGDQRQTVVCFRSIYQVESQQKMETAATRASPGEEKQPRKQRLSNERAIYRPPPARLILKETKEQNIDLVPVQVQNSNVKRPDVALYVPKARRLLGSEVKDDKPKVEMVIKEELPVSTRVRKTGNTTISTTANIKVAVEEVTNQNPTWKEDPKTPLAPPQVHRKISRSNSNSVPQPCELDMGDLMESCELAELSNQVSADEPRTTKVPHNTSYEEDSWEKLYSESGELLQPEALEELTMAVGSIRICQAPHEVYSPFSLEGHDEDLTHVIEVYDFPASFKTEDIFNALSTPGKPPDFSIKWVDDTHALAIYGSPYAALDALNMPHAIAKVRPLAQASKESRTCARRISTALQPFKPRPATSASLAKRMVSTALGIKNTATAEQRKKEREMLADAKARKRLAAQQKEAAWEGTISTH